jgi:hypothetical protein
MRNFAEERKYNLNIGIFANAYMKQHHMLENPHLFLIKENINTMERRIMELTKRHID